MKNFLFILPLLIFTACGVSSLTITTTTLPAARVGVVYSQTLTATGGTAPYTWSVTSGTLPAGLTLSAGAISGTPTTAGSNTFSITVSDSASPVATVTKTFVIQIPLGPGQSITLTRGQSVLVPAGTTVTFNGVTQTVTGDNTTFPTSVGAVVFAPISATGPADNTVSAN